MIHRRRIVAGLLWLAVSSVSLSQSLPDYVPQQKVGGVIRTLGNYHMEKLLTFWEDSFRKHHDGARFENTMYGTANAIAALYLQTADVAVMGREIVPMESIAFRRVFGYDATEIAVATASFDVPLETFAFAIFVHKDNPIRRLTLPQLAEAFGCLKRETVCKPLTWGELGLSREWAKREVHLYGYETNTGLGNFFEQKVFGGKRSWKFGLREYANVNTPDGKVEANAGDLMLRDLANDPQGIAFCGFGHRTPQVKALALANDAASPYVDLTKANVVNRTYPLTRTVYLYINRKPGAPLSSLILEFLHYILSRQGQQDVSRQDIYLPLTEAMVSAERAKLH
jgi:phosphate transport system substrate-binding protein